MEEPINFNHEMPYDLAWSKQNPFALRPSFYITNYDVKDEYSLSES